MAGLGDWCGDGLPRSARRSTVAHEVAHRLGRELDRELDRLEQVIARLTAGESVWWAFDC